MQGEAGEQPSQAMELLLRIHRRPRPQKLNPEVNRELHCTVCW